MRLMKVLFSLFFIIVIIGSHGMADSSKQQSLETAYVAAGCFWCIQKDIDKVSGVMKTEVGYIGGTKETATYDQVSSGKTKHYEALKIVFDPTVVSYGEILDVVWVNLDPHDAVGQFCDKGPQYRAAIFPSNDAQRKIAEASKQKAIAWLQAHEKDANIVTDIIDATPFYAAEEYHQNYYKKNPLRYGFYRSTCGRDRVLETIWEGLKTLPD